MALIKLLLWLTRKKLNWKSLPTTYNCNGVFKKHQIFGGFGDSNGKRSFHEAKWKKINVSKIINLAAGLHRRIELLNIRQMAF